MLLPGPFVGVDLLKLLPDRREHGSQGIGYLFLQVCILQLPSDSRPSVGHGRLGASRLHHGEEIGHACTHFPFRGITGIGHGDRADLLAHPGFIPKQVDIMLLAQ